MELKVKTVEKHTYSIKLSEKEAQNLLSDIVDVLGYLPVSAFRNVGERNDRFPALTDLKHKLQGIDQ